ncbi:MAG: FliA/WhiG family RNA polymerase sigma factor [Candidatus Anstonellales archaeon]
MRRRHFQYSVNLFKTENDSSKDPSTLHRDKMIQTYAPMIKFIAHRLAMRLPPHISIEDLMSAGMIGLIDAISKYDPQKNVKFETYAEFRIRGAMLDELRSLDWVPRSVRQKSSKIERLIERLEKEKGRAVKEEEIASALGMSLEEYYELMKEMMGLPLLEIKGFGKGSSMPSEEEILQLLLDEKEENDPFHNISLKELKGYLAKAIQDLNEKEQLILSLYYYEELTLKEIGEVLGLTESRICQLHNHILIKLRAKLKHYLKESWEILSEI